MSGADRQVALATARVLFAAREWVRRDGIVSRADRVTPEQEAKLEEAETALRRAVEGLDRAERERPS